MIYIGLVSYNSKKDLMFCIPSLLKQVYKNISIIVYDNASTDSTVSWLKKTYPKIPVIQGKTNIGFGKAHNLLINSIVLKRGDWYLCLNPDIVLDSNYIACILNASKNHAFSWATGLILFKNKKHIIYSAGHALLQNGYSFNIGYGMRSTSIPLKNREVFGAPGAAVMYSEQLIKSISDDTMFFDPRMFMYKEDVDIDWRAQLSGFHCYFIKNSIAYHKGSSLSLKLCGHSIVNRYLGVIKNASLTDLIFYNIPHIIGHLMGRIMTTPAAGLWMTQLFLTNLPFSIRHRTQRKVSKKLMQKWFIWSKSQPGAEDSTMAMRAKKFFSHKYSLFTTI